MRKDFRHENISGGCILKKDFMAPFYGWGSTASMLPGDSLLFTNKSTEIPGTNLINLGKMKG